MRRIFYVLLFVAFGLSAFSMNAWAGEPLLCRVTGGGVDTAGDDFGWWDGTWARGKFKKNGGGVNRYTFGGQAGAPTASQPQPYGEWTHHQQKGPDGSFTFHAGTSSAPDGTEIDFVICRDPGTCKPSGDPPSPARQIDFEGVGTFKNIKNPSELLGYVVPGETYHWFEVHIEDLGEPGNNGKQSNLNGCPPEGSAGNSAKYLCGCPDFYQIDIHETADPASLVIYGVFGYIDGGNLQIHYPVHD